jgi:hypothetical protein
VAAEWALLTFFIVKILTMDSAIIMTESTPKATALLYKLERWKSMASCCRMALYRMFSTLLLSAGKRWN